ncbi:MAG: nucleoside triphosphate pyrophosphohydrolase family protein [Halobacteriovoraceae bacterium]|jgi:NTP pyrophosphatase (non-canonical NTP hydrolase)|nr:nucleoside triphosphate pyrophosphohydrolase family protein [Halobacteriovoraceae bacterium]
MNSKEYIQDAIRTEADDFQGMDIRLYEDGTKRLLHAGIGMATEAGEFLDALKKHIFYGKDLDRVNLKEELGDLFWYMAIACDELDIEFEPIMERNIEKLRARYGEKFSEVRADKRDLKKERVILEQ